MSVLLSPPALTCTVYIYGMLSHVHFDAALESMDLLAMYLNVYQSFEIETRH
jgi:hypothetical protein